MAACIPVKSLLIRLLAKKSLLLKTQQLILGTGTAIWWLTEPHLYYPGGGLVAPSILTIGFLLIHPGWLSQLRKWYEHSSNGLDKLKNFTNSNIIKL